jgi:HEAT repeat protein
MLPPQALLAEIDLHVRIDPHISNQLKAAHKSRRARVKALIKATISRADSKRTTVTTVDTAQMIEVRTLKEADSRRVTALISRVADKADFLIKRISSRALQRTPLRLSLL